jgi:vacuolar-type H+-ATPase subunit I/STV1
MTVTPSLSSPNAWPLTDELADIDQKIADLQRTADQAQTSSAVAASEVASAQKAIRELSTAKAEILEQGRLWDRDAQLQRALAERKAVADRVRPVVDMGGSLDVSKTALENRLKPKLKIAATTSLNALNTAVQNAENALEDAELKRAFASAQTALKAAESDYQAKADAAEAAWLAIQNGARILEERLQSSQSSCQREPRDKTQKESKEHVTREDLLQHC